MCAQCHDNPANTLPPNCFNTSLCHGPRSGHPAGWRDAHTGVNPAQAPTCAQCHDNPANNLAPGCFNNSLCHGQKAPHPAGWLATHTATAPAQAPSCAQCHDNPANNLAPGCFNNSLCHGQKAPHPAGWLATHTATDPAQAPSCAQCHDNPANTLPPNCFNTSLCHGTKGEPPGRLVIGQPARRRGEGRGSGDGLVHLLPRRQLRRRHLGDVLLPLPRLERPARALRLGRRRQQTSLGEPVQCRCLRELPPFGRRDGWVLQQHALSRERLGVQKTHTTLDIPARAGESQPSGPGSRDPGPFFAREAMCETPCRRS